MKKTIISAIQKSPEGKIKNLMRSVILMLSPGVPNELMAANGDTVLNVGIRHIKSLESWRKCVGETGQLILIEGDSRNCKVLKDHIEEKKYTNVHLVPTAVGAEIGEQTFLVSDRPSDNRLKDDNIDMDNDLRDEYAEEITVQLSTIDEIVKNHDVKRIDCILITVNGAEFDVIKGMKNSLSITKRIYAKAHAIDKASNSPLNVMISSYLANNGFKTKITKPTPSVAAEWGDRSGDVYAWR